MNHFDNLPDVIILSVLFSMDDARTIINLKRTFSQYKTLINQNVVYLYTDKTLKLHISNIVNFTNLLMISHNITIIIDDKDHLLVMKNLLNLKQINFYIGIFDNEYDTVDYLESFLISLPNKELYDKTYRLLFDVKNKDETFHYGYIFDRGYFTIANINNMRSINCNNFYNAEINFLYKVEGLFIKYLPTHELYTCVYTKTDSRTFRKDKGIKIDLFDVKSTNKLIKNSIIILAKADTSKEIYHSNDMIKEICGPLSKSNGYTTSKTLSLIYLLHGESKDIIEFRNNTGKKVSRCKKTENIYVKPWNDEVFIKYFNKELFESIYNNETDEEGKEHAKQFVDNQVKFDVFISFLLNHCHPIDIIDKEYLNNLILPLKKSYLTI